MRRLLLVALAILATLTSLMVPARASARVAPVDAGATGGDAYFPAAGNGGYQVDSYALRLRYNPTTRALGGIAVITARAGGRPLRSFSLDLRGFAVSSVTVGGTRARFARIPGELRVTPTRVIPARGRFIVSVTYSGRTGRPVDPTGSLFGWVSTADGAVVASQPDGASTWFPVNDLPADTATFDITMTVPKAKTVVSNGDLVSTRTSGAWRTWRWATRDPQAPYLATVAIGDFDLTRTRTPSGLPVINAVDRKIPAVSRTEITAVLRQQPAMLSFLSRYLGSYPFKTVGAIVDDEDLGYALETQTRPVYGGFIDDSTVVHELAHQWVGDSVALQQWRDIWLNEGFASYLEWMWDARRDGTTVEARAQKVYADPRTGWTVLPGNPGALKMFDNAVYDRGALTLHALRKTIGDAAFFTVLKTWTTQNRGRSVTTEKFIALAEKVSKRQLDALFDTWLYTAGKPARL